MSCFPDSAWLTRMWNVSCLILIGMVAPATVKAQTEEEVAAYAIPVDAVRRGPFTTRVPGESEYTYYERGTNPDAPLAVPKRFQPLTYPKPIGREWFQGGVLTRRALFKGEKKHGVQREWYRNGRLNWESPYKNGVRDGLFRHWDENGSLTAQYQMDEGDGTERIYDLEGTLISERGYKGNELDGLAMELETGTRIRSEKRIRSLVWYRRGVQVGRGYGFYPDEAVASLSWLTDEGLLQGPAIDFRAGGEVSHKAWFIREKVVSEAEYSKVAAARPDLPQYFEDAQKYKGTVPDDVWELLKKYRSLPKVKIPLEFDELGNPVLAPAA